MSIPVAAPLASASLARPETAPAAEAPCALDDAFNTALDERPGTAPQSARLADADDTASEQDEQDCVPPVDIEAVCDDLAESLESLDLQSATASCVTLFRGGFKQEALEAAVAFAQTAKLKLGRMHPTYINAIATVAALADQLGGTDEADMLLLEAESLHEELALKAEAEGDESDEAVETGDDDAGSTSDAGCSSDGEDGDVEESRLMVGSGAACGSRASKPSEAAFNESDGENEADEAEAEAITRLTWEVNALLREGRPDDAAKLLNEAEEVLLGGGVFDLKGVSQAALHTLWAAVLDDIGEGDKARCLYDEAMRCLDEEMEGFANYDSSSDGESEAGVECDSDNGVTSDNGVMQDEEDVDVDVFSTALPRPTGGSDAGSGIARIEEPSHDAQIAAPAVTSSSVTQPEQSLKAEEEIAADAAEATVVPAPPKGSPPARGAGPRGRRVGAAVSASPSPEPAASPSPEPADLPQQTDKCLGPSQSTSVDVPSQQEEATKNMPSAITPPQVQTPAAQQAKSSATSSKQTSTSSAKVQAAKPATRAGGGFAVVAPPKAAAPKAAAPKAKRRPKAKAAPSSAVEPDDVASEESPATLTAPADDSPAKQEPPVSLEEVERREVLKAMTVADHFLGLMKFDRAADKLEEQLVGLTKSTSPHHHTDLHIDVLMKYGGVLWWDGDAEGAIDAMTAGDEILEDRKSDSPVQKRRRADIWTQVAQVYRSCGDLDSADEHLSDAVQGLRDLLDAKEGARVEGEDLGGVEEALREAMAALGQVCVQKEEFQRAEELYMAAFSDQPLPKLEKIEEVNVDKS